MADTPQTPVAVAYQLMRDVLAAEGGALSGDGPSRAWLLTTYAECLKTVRPEVAKASPTHGRSSF